MKTERRHELQSNELANWIANHYKTIEPYTKSIVAVAIALLVAYSAWSFISARSKEKEAAEWDKFDGGREQLNALAQRYSPGTALGNVARLSMADINFNEGMEALMKDRTEGLRLLKAARDDYFAVANSSTDPMIQPLAWCGKAKSEEAMGDLDAARTDYERLLGKGPLFAYDEYAKQRLADLKRPSVKEFYTVLAETRAKPPEGPGTPGKRPSTDLFEDSAVDKSSFGKLPDETKKPTDDKIPLFPTDKLEDKGTELPKTPDSPKTPETTPEKSSDLKTPALKTPVATPDKTPASKTPAAPATKTPKK